MINLHCEGSSTLEVWRPFQQEIFLFQCLHEDFEHITVAMMSAEFSNRLDVLRLSIQVINLPRLVGDELDRLYFIDGG